MANNVITIIFNVSSAVVVLIIIVVYQLGWVDHLRHLLIYTASEQDRVASIVPSVNSIINTVLSYQKDDYRPISNR